MDGGARMGAEPQTDERLDVGRAAVCRACSVATKHWRLLGARSQGEVHGFYVAQLRQQHNKLVLILTRHTLARAGLANRC